MNEQEAYFSFLKEKLKALDATKWPSYQVNIDNKIVELHYQNHSFARATVQAFGKFVTHIQSPDAVFWCIAGDICDYMPMAYKEKLLYLKNQNGVVQYIPGLDLSVYDKKNDFYFWCMDQNTVTSWIRDGALTTKRLLPNRLFSIWANENNLAILHAAGICKNGKCILVAGKSGAGKSTFCAEALSQGFETVGDDYVLITLKGDLLAEPYICRLTLRQNAKIKTNLSARKIGAGYAIKEEFDINQYTSNKPCSVIGIVELTRNQKTPSLVSDKSTSGLRAMVQSTICQTSSPTNFSLISNLNKRLQPISHYTLEEGINITEAVNQLNQLFD